MRRVLLALGLAALAVACGEPAIDVEIPERQGGAHVLDLAQVLDTAALEVQLSAIAEEGLDVVALTYTTAQASCGEAFRAGGELASAWEADVAIVAVAREGDFTSTADDRERCVGLQPADQYAVPGGLREEIAEGLLPPIAAENDWDRVFAVAAHRLAEELVGGP